MSMRKIGVVGSFAAGAAVALAPLAAAVGDPFDFSSIVQGEVQSMNWLFETQAALSGDSADITKVVPTQADPLQFDTIAKTDMSSTFQQLVYGFNPDNVAGDPGSYGVMNGALVQFDNGFNSLLFASMNNGDALDWDSGALFGGASAQLIAENALNGWAEASSYFQFGMGDVLGYFDLSALFG